MELDFDSKPLLPTTTTKRVGATSDSTKQKKQLKQVMRIFKMFVIIHFIIWTALLVFSIIVSAINNGIAFLYPITLDVRALGPPVTVPQNGPFNYLTQTSLLSTYVAWPMILAVSAVASLYYAGLLFWKEMWNGYIQGQFAQNNLYRTAFFILIVPITTWVVAATLGIHDIFFLMSLLLLQVVLGFAYRFQDMMNYYFIVSDPDTATISGKVDKRPYTSLLILLTQFVIGGFVAASFLSYFYVFLPMVPGGQPWYFHLFVIFFAFLQLVPMIMFALRTWGPRSMRNAFFLGIMWEVIFAFWWGAAVIAFLLTIWPLQ